MILCCGEALIDMLPRRLPSGEAVFAPHPGGAIFNTAIALGRLGRNVGMLTALSKDMFGVQLLTALQTSHVMTDAILRSDQPSTLAFVELLDGQARYAFFDENSAESMLRVEDLPQLPIETAALYFGGISLVREPGGDFYAALAAREQGKRVIMLDPNIRIGFIRDEALYRGRLDRMIAAANVIKVSDEDLDWLVPAAGSEADQIRALVDNRRTIVILTRGAKGASAWLPSGEIVDLAIEPADVVDTVGAGDTFNAGVLASLQAANLLSPDKVGTTTAAQMQEALHLGARVASITVSRAGANPPWAAEI